MVDFKIINYELRRRLRGHYDADQSQEGGTEKLAHWGQEKRLGYQLTSG